MSCLFFTKIRFLHFSTFIAAILILCPGFIGVGLAVKKTPLKNSNHTGPDQIAAKVRMIKLYTVHNGKVQNRLISSEELQRTHSYEVDGYVTGILVLSDFDMRARIDGQEMAKIRRNKNGTYSIKNFGEVDAAEFQLSANSTYSQSGPLPEENPYVQASRGSLPDGYSYFSRVVGDAVAPQDTFCISMGTGQDSCEVSITQNGYQQFHSACFHSGENYATHPIEFCYLGERLTDYTKLEDFEERLAAIAQGIHSVEQTFGLSLVTRVRIVDYDGVRNAVTCEKNNDIWFYINALEKEPIAELKTMAEHETLHVLVDRMGFVKRCTVRELFADLKGYDIFSSERFMLVMKGISPADGGSRGATDQKFFAFIDERNFLEGMKGGHSSRSMEEFCTSFLHSLMYRDRLRENLDRPITMTNGGSSVLPLSFQQKQEILNNYIRILEVLVEAPFDAGNQGAQNETSHFLKACIEETKTLSQQVQLANAQF